MKRIRQALALLLTFALLLAMGGFAEESAEMAGAGEAVEEVAEESQPESEIELSEEEALAAPIEETQEEEEDEEEVQQEAPEEEATVLQDDAESTLAVSEDISEEMDEQDVLAAYIPVIGICQFNEHELLNECRVGFFEGLKDDGLTEGVDFKIDYQNANSSAQECERIAEEFVLKDVDLMFGIAVTAAQACYLEAREAYIPVLYSAVLDPEVGGLNGENITGTTDMVTPEAYFTLIHALQPDVKTINMVYSSDDLHSVSTVNAFQNKANAYGFTFKSAAISKINEVVPAVQQLYTDGSVPQPSCFIVNEDFTVGAALPLMLKETNSAGILVYGCELQQVQRGCIAAPVPDYAQLGRQTGAMAAKILKGEATADNIPVETSDKYINYINKTELEACGMSAPKGIDYTLVEETSVTPDPEPSEPESIITLSFKSATLNQGESVKLTAKTEGLKKESYTFKSSDTKIAAVSKTGGKITAKAKGTVTITVTGKKSKQSASCTVNVLSAPAKISLDKATATCNIGEMFQIASAIEPADAVQDVVWSVNNDKATVDGGIVTAKKEGKVTITATTQAKNKKGKKLSAKCVLTIYDPAKPREVSIDQGSVAALYTGSESLQLTAKVIPETAPQTVTWSIPTKQQKIATIDANGLLKPGTKTGTVTVTVKTTATMANRKPATKTIKVTVGADPTKPFTVTLDHEGTVELKVGQTLQLAAAIAPETAETKTVTYSSSNKKVATVDATGLVTGVKAGKTATITVKTANGKKDTVKIKVVK